MEKFLKNAIDLIENDRDLLDFPLDIQSSFINLIRGCRYESIKEIVDNFFALSEPNKSLFFLRAVCFLKDKKFEESKVALSHAMALVEGDLNLDCVKVFKQFEIEIIRQEQNESQDKWFEKVLQENGSLDRK